MPQPNGNGHAKVNPYQVSIKANGQDRLPPHSIEAEEGLLGSLLLDPDAILLVDEFLRPEHFYRVHYGWIYETISEMHRDGRGVDLLTVCEELRQRGKLEQVGGEDALIRFISTVPTAINARAYAKIIETAALRRRMINAAGKLAGLAWNEADDLEVQLEQAESMVMTIRGEAGQKGVQKPSRYVREYLDNLESVASGEREVIGLPTGFTDLDKLLGGLIAPFHYILAGRPGMGKSAMLIAIADHLVMKRNKRVLLFSLEMSTGQVTQRILALNTRIDSQRLRMGDIKDHEWPLVYRVLGELGTKSLFIDETPGLSPSQIRAKARRVYAEYGLDLIMIDHMHLMTADHPTGDRVKDMGDISRVLTYLGKDLNVPVLTAAQLSRKVEDRSNKRPVLSDLRDSGSIEENAFAVMFLYRDEYYNKDTSDRPNIAELEVAKHRDGPTFVVDLYWHGRLAALRNLQRQEIQL